MRFGGEPMGVETVAASVGSASADGIHDETYCDGSILKWVLEDGRKLSTGREFLTEVVRRLRNVGLPIARVTVNIETLHPDLRAINYVWDRARPEGAEIGIEHGVERSDMYLRSPLYPVFERRETVRRRLVSGEADPDYPILEDLRAQGMTDYIAMPMPFSTSERQAVTWATDRPGGFSEAHLSWLANLMPVLGLVFEVYAVKRTAVTLLDTYLGHRTGTHVLEGRIRRGDGETVLAVIWFCDIRGFTALSEQLPREQVIDLLNDFFGCVARPVQARGGEILKFIGDAMLAIFPVEDAMWLGQTCRATEAAVEAIETLRELQERRQMAGEAPFDFGIGLHVGEVTYGNIGAPGRLDFTVIGPDVNLTSRLQNVTREAGVPLVVSGSFARQCSYQFRSIGHYRFRGISREHEAFTLSSIGAGAAQA